MTQPDPRPSPALASPPESARLAAQAQHRRAITEFHGRRADRQARIDALLLEAVAALARLLTTPEPEHRTARPASPEHPAATSALPTDQTPARQRAPCRQHAARGAQPQPSAPSPAIP